MEAVNETVVAAVVVVVVVAVVVAIAVVRAGRARYRSSLRGPFGVEANIDKGHEGDVEHYPPAGHAEIDDARAKDDITAHGKSSRIRKARSKRKITAIASAPEEGDDAGPKA